MIENYDLSQLNKILSDARHEALCARHAAKVYLKVYKRNLHQLKQLCAERCFETLRVKSVEICLMAIYARICNETS